MNWGFNEKIKDTQTPKGTSNPQLPKAASPRNRPSSTEYSLK